MAFLLITAGDRQGERIEITTDEVTLGRAPDNVVQITDASSSSHHCTIMRDGQKYTLRDNNSTNGTGLNGIAVREARLKPKDVIGIGGVDIVFDGSDIEVDQTALAKEAFGPSDTVRLTTFDPSLVSKPASFGTRKDSKKTWVRAIVVIGVLALVALAYFIWRLFGPQGS